MLQMYYRPSALFERPTVRIEMEYMYFYVVLVFVLGPMVRLSPSESVRFYRLTSLIG